MLRFNIVPLNAAHPPMEISADDAAGVFQLIERTGCKAADVERDGAHAFSLVLADNGLWSIFKGPLRKRAGAAKPERLGQTVS